VTDLSEEDDSTDLEYVDVDGGGVMLVEDLEDERENMPLPPPIIQVDTPHPVILQELIPIEELAPITPAIKVEEGEDDTWYIPPTMCRWMHPLDGFSTC
jgi:hypothetical protein